MVVKAGKMYGRMTLIERIDGLWWSCRCECGRVEKRSIKQMGVETYAGYSPCCNTCPRIRKRRHDSYNRIDGETVKAYRESLGLNQNQAAKLYGVTRQGWSSYERKGVSRKAWLMITTVLGSLVQDRNT